MAFTDTIKKAVWNKATIVEGYDQALIRKDPCGAWIMWEKYGIQDNIFGWEIDHIYPKSLLEGLGYSSDEIDDLSNLRAMQHQNNASKGVDYPSYTAFVSSEGNKNVVRLQNLTVNKKTRTLLNSLYPKIK